MGRGGPPTTTAPALAAKVLAIASPMAVAAATARAAEALLLSKSGHLGQRPESKYNASYMQPSLRRVVHEQGIKMELLNLASAIVPVTGAASGIGLGICKRLRAAGATPLLLDFNEKALESAVREVFPDAGSASRHGYLVDVRDSKAVDGCFADIQRDHGLVTHAVANAGIVIGAHILDITDDQWHQVMNVNLHGVMYFCRAAARQLAEAKRGSIVTMASLAGLRAKENRISYTASKAAVVNMTRSLALDLGRFGVRVNAVAPGFIKTPMQQTKPAAELQAIIDKVPLGRLGDPDEIAKVVLFLLSDLASYVTGETIVTDGGVMAKYL